MDNPKVILGNTKDIGQGLFANDNIEKGEVIAEFDGVIYEKGKTLWTDELRNHVIQFEQNKWRDSKGFARYINHSCDPNCGVKELFKIVAMRNINKGEELTWDYEMTEDNDVWRMQCKCGSAICRKEIGAYRNMPEDIRQKYKGYISDWLIKKSPTGGLR